MISFISFNVILITIVAVTMATAMCYCDNTVPNVIRFLLFYYVYFITLNSEESEGNRKEQKETERNERTVYYWLSRRNGNYSQYCMYVLCIVLETSVKIMCVKCVLRCCSFQGVPYLPRKKKVVVVRGVQRF